MQSYKIFSLVIGMVLSFLPGCWQSAKAPALYVVDVNLREVYKDAHIKGATHIEFDDIQKYANEWNKDIPVVFYCSNYQCTGSSYAAREFKKNGFKHVYAYEGGIAEWYQLHKNDPAYIEGPANEEYLKRVSEQPEHTETDVEIISAQELEAMMKKAGLL